MRKLLVGVNSHGRSAIAEEHPVVTATVADIPGIAVANLFSTTQSPPPPRPTGNGDFVDLGLAPGLVRCMVVEHAAPGTYGPANMTGKLHYADVLYLVYVERGSIELRLEHDVRQLEPGDFVVMPGVDHAYTAGPEGCRLLVVEIGTPPPQSAAEGHR
jgi:quercetin dioxygenase-like cupin family protein